MYGAVYIALSDCSGYTVIKKDMSGFTVMEMNVCAVSSRTDMSEVAAEEA